MITMCRSDDLIVPPLVGYGHVAVLGLSVRLSRYPMRVSCDACTVVCIACVYGERM